MATGPVPDSRTLRDMLYEQRTLPSAIAGDFPELRRSSSEDSQLIGHLYALASDVRGRLELLRGNANESYYTCLLSFPQDSNQSEVHILIHRTLRVVAAKVGYEFVDADLNWSLLDQIGWLYLSKEICDTALTEFDIPEGVGETLHSLQLAGHQTLGYPTFNWGW